MNVSNVHGPRFCPGYGAFQSHSTSNLCEQASYSGACHSRTRHIRQRTQATMSSNEQKRREFSHDLNRACTILIKIGTEIVHSPEGLLAMGQIGNIVEQIAMLHMRGHNIILVSSGSITIGKMVLHRQYLLSGSMQSHLGGQVGDNVQFYEKACAAAGQSGLQSFVRDAPRPVSLKLLAGAGVRRRLPRAADPRELEAHVAHASGGWNHPDYQRERCHHASDGTSTER
ncbi:hypothetical protein ON010_g11189 [Phytophthora cinnamomi]|nr:hypothetical protein ON010_g11189 [Phytophthora cinnamomi]